MAAITGAAAKMGLKKATTWGTAVACGAGNQFIAEVSPSMNVQELTARAIGSGKYMDYDATIANFVPTFGLVGDFGYNNNWPLLFASFFQTAAISAELTSSQGDYRHTLTMATSLSTYLTLAYENTSTTTMEAPTASVRSIGLKTTSVPGYLEASGELLANTASLTSSTNTNATLANVTNPDSELVAARFTDDFYIETAGGTISSADQYNVTGWQLDLQRPMEIIPEITNSAGNGVPRIEGLINGTFTANVKELADTTYYTVWTAETIKKGQVICTGTQIGSGSYKSITVYMPKMKLIDAPDNPFTSAGINPLTLKFKLLVAASSESGMTGSLYPYIEIINSRTTALLA